MRYYRRNSDERIRQLERRARSGDTGAINSLYLAKKRAGDPNAGAELFELKAAIREIPEPQIDLFARLGFAPAVEVFPEIFGERARLQRRFTLKHIKELGQVATIKLIGIGLQKTFGLALNTVPYRRILRQAKIDPLEFEKTCFSAVQEIRQWKPGQKLNKKTKNILITYENELLPLEDDWGYYYTMINLVNALINAYRGRLTRKGATGYANDADGILKIIESIWLNLAENCDNALHCLGEQINPILAEDLLLEKIEQVPRLDRNHPDYYKQEITAKRFTSVTIWLPKVGNEHVIVWTDNKAEVEIRARKIAAHMGWKVKRLTYNQDRMHAKVLLEKGLHEDEMLQEGFEPKLSRGEIKALEKIHRLRVRFLGGKKEYLEEVTRKGKRTFPGKRFTKKEAQITERDVQCFIDKLISIGFKDHRPVKVKGKHGYILADGILRSIGANVADSYAVEFIMQRKDPRWDTVKEFIEECNGEGLDYIRVIF